MTDPTLEIFSTFVNAFRGLVDADEAKTLAAITPILGDQVNVSTLSVVSKFLTELLYESVEIDAPSYVCLKGVRISVSHFDNLHYLVSSTPPGVLAKLADALATLPAGASFPESFVPYKDPSNYDSHHCIDVAREAVYRKFVGKTYKRAVAEHSFPTSLVPEVGDATA